MVSEGPEKMPSRLFPEVTVTVAIMSNIAVTSKLIVDQLLINSNIHRTGIHVKTAPSYKVYPAMYIKYYLIHMKV